MEEIFYLQDNEQLKELFGPYDVNLRAIEKEFNVKITSHAQGLKISGTKKEVLRAVNQIANLVSRPPAAQRRGLPEIRPQSKGQKEYVEAIKKYDVVFAIGPAGTGKTYLAVYQAQEALKARAIKRIILTRPAVEAGESLGYLPGDIHEKLSPYLRPLYDALYDMMDTSTIERYVEKGIIEIAPLAYMRGRTLNDAFIILDEAQNCTGAQLKMILTRIGFDSRVVITGDITQSDLPGAKPSGLLQAQKLLCDIEGIKFIYLTKSDVVRHKIVQNIIEAYEKDERKAYKT
ncbi:MAG: PhoH family protein [Candidatus Omnitrophica bacterium]|nr:PhoH family protein [Candidatus Omnitrophota bacterium]